MTSLNDIRWLQRFSNYQKALSQLEKFVIKGDLSDMEELGLIKAFQYTIREAYKKNLIDKGEEWMKMIVSRNLTSHSYNEDTADEIASAVLNEYFDLFKSLELKLKSLRSGDQDELFEA